MGVEKFRWLAAVIAAHPNRQLIGRKRLQKTIKLLQRLGLPADYTYTAHFYGPYSEGIQADIRLLERSGLVREDPRFGPDGLPSYVFAASEDAVLPGIDRFQPYISAINKTDLTTLELAATYDAFREQGSDHETALARLRRKKGSKCEGGREEAALKLLSSLGLPTT